MQIDLPKIGAVIFAGYPGETPVISNIQNSLTI